MKNSNTRKNTKSVLDFVKLLVLINLLALGLMISFTHAIPGETNQVTIKLKNGEKVAFTEKSMTLERDEYNCIKLPDTFESMVSVTLPNSNRVDAETYYFQDDWETNENVYAYSFTGWQIKGTTKRIPSMTVFQPGDYMDLEYLAENEYTKNLVAGNQIEMEALWGKVIFIQNQYNQMKYNKYAFFDKESSALTGETGAKDENSGRTVADPIATLNHAYEQIEIDIENYDPYINVIMLVGNLDYIKTNNSSLIVKQEGFDKGYQSDYFGYGVEGKNSSSYVQKNSKSVTIKSLLSSDNNRYMLKLKGYTYYINPIGSLRIDNVDMVLIKPEEITDYDSNILPIYGYWKLVLIKKGFYETTNRCTNSRGKSFSVAGCSTKNIVLNGGVLSLDIGNSLIESNGGDRRWVIGQNANVSSVTLGATNQNFDTNMNSNIRLDVYGAKIGSIYGSSSPYTAITGGNRKIKIIDATIGSVFGGGSNGVLYGNIEIDVRNSIVTNLHGGGYSYSANVYGNIEINVLDSTVKRIYGGGYNGNVLIVPSGAPYGNVGTGGDVKLNISNSNITGNIFGSGMGGTQTVEINKFTSFNYLNGDKWPAGWEKPISNYPSYNEENGRVLIGGYKLVSYEFGSTTIFTYTRNVEAYLSLATVENLDMNITNSTVKGNIYGGGSIAVINGNTNIHISDNSVIEGNVYGGGDGVTKPTNVVVYEPIPEDGYVAPGYRVNEDGSISLTNNTENTLYKRYSLGTFKWSNDPSVLEAGGIDIERKLIYSTNTEGLGKVSGNTKVTIDNSEVKKDVYAGGNNGIVGGTTTLNIMNGATVVGNAYGGCNTASVEETEVIIENAIVNKNVYGGSNDGNVNHNVNVKITNGKINSIYTGGNNGDVKGNCNLIVNSGTMNTVFGGGNLGTVDGNTNVIIGNADNHFVTISNLLYGGGKGSSPEFETVKGTATVLIEGLNTHVENYGSSKLGKVVGNVDVTFKDYWTGNTTNKYKIMNGIDRATNVYFENSYVLLKNIDESGNLVGIKDITNLYIPENSGLKISADGEIAGDFHGGGTLYLDSGICITVRGNIYEKTLVVLNPEIVEGINLIKGSKEHPYMRVYGEDTSGGTALYSTDTKYTILHSTESSGAGIYYINADVYITETIFNTIKNIKEKHYTDDASTWSEEDFYMINSGIFSTDCKVQIDYLDDGNLENKYKNITRKVAIYTGDTIVTIPKNANMVMVTNGELYKYRVGENLTEISLNDFVNMENGAIKYEGVSDVRSVATEIGGNEFKKSYRYEEKFRFIVDFSECQSEDLLLRGPYNLIINYYDFDEETDVTSDAMNVVRIEEPRKYNGTITFDRDWYEQRGKINMDMVTKSDSYILYDEADREKDLVAVLAIKDEAGEYVTFSNQLAIYIDRVKKEHTNGNVTFTVMNGLVKDAFTKTQKVTIDMSTLADSELFGLGNKKMSISYYIAKDNVLEKKVSEYEAPFEIISYNVYSLYSVVKAEGGIQGKELLKINRSEDNSRTIQMNYKGDLQKPYVEIKIQKYDGSKYVGITNSITNSKYILTSNTQTIEAIFGNELSPGKYKMIFLLSDKYGDVKVTEAIDFECN